MKRANELLEESMDLFRVYEKSHQRKAEEARTTGEHQQALDKALRNKQIADKIETFLRGQMSAQTDDLPDDYEV